MKRSRLALVFVCLCGVFGAVGWASGQRSGSVDSAALALEGRERIAWDVDVDPGRSLSEYEFAVFVDGQRRPLLDVQCEHLSGASAACSGQPPWMSAGQHVLEVVTVLDGDESPRSPPLTVDILTRSASSSLQSAAAAVRDASDAATASPAAADLTDLAITPDGLILVSARDGRLHVLADIDDTRGWNEPALTLHDVATSPGFGLLAVAAHPSFARSRYVYFAYVAQSAVGPVYRVVRGREVGKRIGELAVVLDGVPAGAPAGISLRFGPDGKMYVALGPTPGGRAHPYNGSLLRLEDDGTTPHDSRALSPVYADRLGLPHGIAWTPDGKLWMAASRDGVTRIEQIGGESILLPPGEMPTSMAAVTTRGTTELWMGRRDQPGLSIVRIGGSSPRLGSAATPVQQRSSGSIGCLASHPGGGVIVCDAANPDTREALVRVVAAR
jgi:hypothetical protein